jgi:hypothetical protein
MSHVIVKTNNGGWDDSQASTSDDGYQLPALMHDWNPIYATYSNQRLEGKKLRLIDKTADIGLLSILQKNWPAKKKKGNSYSDEIPDDLPAS